jgi:minichromosome maintenance protein 10
VIRLLPNKQGYDVPVEGDWVTIAVVAERGPVKFTRAPVGLGCEGDVKDRRKEKQSAMSNDKDKTSNTRTELHGKKYVNLKLIDFGCRTRSSSSHTGGQATIRGDAFLSLLLFESDGFDTVTSEDATRGRKVYKGGSKGAFETMAKLKEGAVIALLNPKVLKPFQVWI